MATRIFRFINKIIFLEKKKIFAHEGVKLFPSEIHLMLWIEQGETGNATRIAQGLGISKSAVSQTLSRLEKKNILIKEKDTSNKNELILSFTGFGSQALNRYKQTLLSGMAGHGQYLESLSDEEKRVIRQFMAHMESVIETLE